MNLKKKVLLLNPPANGDKIIKDQYCSFTSKAGYYWIPIDLLILSGSLSDQFEVLVIDSIIDKLSIEDTMSKVIEFQPDHIVVLSSILTHVEDRALINSLKEKFSFINTFIGDVFYFKPESMIKFPEVDSIALEYPCNELIDYILTGEAKSNLIYKKNNEIIQLPINNAIEITYKTPRHDLFPLKKYSVPFMSEELCSSVLTNFGCKFTCNYCPASSVNYRERPVKEVILELEHLEENGISNFWLRDFTFGLNKTRTLEILEFLKNKSFSWFCLSRAEVLNKELIELMKSAGCYLIMIGVDTVNSESMKSVNRKQNLKNLKSVIEVSKRNNIQVLVHMILGLPGDTWLGMVKTIHFVASTPSNYLSINFFSPRAGSNYFEVDSIEKNARESLDSLFPDSKISFFKKIILLKLKVYALILFYLNPFRIIRIIRQLSNKKQFLLH